MKKTQVIIIGGGLAGLTAAIDLRLKGVEVTLFEKNEYPHHKVCGEYLSNEVLPYLNSLGIELSCLAAPKINKLEYSSCSGNLINCDLDMGGIGISRFGLDQHLYKKAIGLGCTIVFSTVNEVIFTENGFRVNCGNKDEYYSDFVLGAFGKRSNIDKKLKRDFFKNQAGWLAVKAHYKNSKYPEELVSLHNFKGGYCGLSRTEMNSINVCYLATYSSFKRYKNTVDYKNEVLMRNPRLKEFFENSEMIFDKELTIAQVNFEKKTLIDDHIIMIGDSAGLIHPLCGNGMAMAIHSAKMAAYEIDQYYKNKSFSRLDIENNYKVSWGKNFNKRIKAGRILQRVLLNDSLSNLSQSIIRRFPGVIPHIIKSTHGKPVYV